jgi:hypothetical protein
MAVRYRKYTQIINSYCITVSLGGSNSKETRNIYQVSVGKSHGKRPLRNLRRCVDNIKVGVRETGSVEYELE